MAIEESATSDDQWADADDNGFGDSGNVAVETQAAPDTETTATDVEETPSEAGSADADEGVDGGSPATPQSKPQGEVQAGDAEQPTQPKFPAELLQSLGLSEQQAQQRFGTPEQLETAVRLQDQLMMNAGRAAMQAQSSRQQPPPQSRQAAPPVPQDQAAQQQAAQAAQLQQQQKAANPFEAFQFDPNEWDPATAKLLQGMNEHYAKQIQSLAGLAQPVQQMETALQGLLNVQLQQAQASYVQEFESEVNSLGDEWKDLFGKGSGMEMDRNSPQIQNRIKLDEAMLMLARGRRESGLQPLTQKELFQRALRLEFPNKTTAIAQKQVISKATSRAKQFTQRPTGRNGKPLSGDEAAMSRVESFFQDRGFTQDADEDLGDALI